MTSTAPFTRLSSSLMPNETAICGPTIELLLSAQTAHGGSARPVRPRRHEKRSVRGRSSEVERQLPKLNVVGSIPIARSTLSPDLTRVFAPPDLSHQLPDTGV